MIERVLVTGGAGFIGSAFLNRFVPTRPDLQFLNVDKLTYAANLGNLQEIASQSNYQFCRLDLADTVAVRACVQRFNPDWVIHFAAETHVDRSIRDPRAFLEANTKGTFNLLEACRDIWQNTEGKVFLNVSTDEVYGELGPEGAFSETSSYSPNSPYSASKAAADHFCRAYAHTYRLPVKITNCSNNYGPRQFPEKLIPLMILNAAENKPLPVYGEGLNVRDWLFVDDHCDALWQVAERGKVGETYCVGGGHDVPNIEIVRQIARLVGERVGDPHLDRLITFVPDRPGHDFRYAIDATKIKNELGWSPATPFEEGLRKTVDWYLSNPDWVSGVRTGAYRDWMTTHYGEAMT